MTISSNNQELDQKICCGIDVGSAFTKTVLLDASARCLAISTRLSGTNYEQAANMCLAEALERANCHRESVGATVVTGYGRECIRFAQKQATEIRCHALGCSYHQHKAILIVDIGSQDNKIIEADDKGNVIRFKMNRKCAAGTGAFLEEIALRLGISLEELHSLALTTQDPVSLSSFCTVFAKTEILHHLRQGTSPARIALGAYHSVMHRILEMGPLSGVVTLSGGVAAYHPLLADLFRHRDIMQVSVAPNAQHMGAWGAALIALQILQRD